MSKSEQIIKKYYYNYLQNESLISKLGIQTVITNKEIRFPITIPDITQNKWSNKPLKAFWTSSYTPNKKYISEWHRWLIDENWNVPNLDDNVYLLKPKSNARICKINDYQDLLEIIEGYNFEGKDKTVDFQALSRDYDAFHLTEQGQTLTRYTEPSLYGYDCESTAWFHPKFDLIQRYKLKDIINKNALVF